VKQYLTLKRRRVEATFALAFPDEEAGRAAAAVLEADGFAAEVRGGVVLVDGGVREDSFDVAELMLREVAARFGGEFRGRLR
jgi:hypothetical protein